MQVSVRDGGEGIFRGGTGPPELARFAGSNNRTLPRAGKTPSPPRCFGGASAGEGLEVVFDRAWNTGRQAGDRSTGREAGEKTALTSASAIVPRPWSGP